MAQAYKVDFTTRTITITAEFEKAMSNPEAAEYKIIRQLCADFPGMRIVKRTHRTPTHYTSKNGEKSACNPYKNLTYGRIYIIQLFRCAGIYRITNAVKICVITHILQR